MRIRTLAAFVAAAGMLTACDGLKEAFTAHVDVAARAAGQELSVTRLGELLGGSNLQVPVSKENARVVADLWVSYQLLGLAAARGDTMSDTATVMAAARSIVDNIKIQQLMDSVSRGWTADTATEQAYTSAQGGLYAARHILLGTENLTPAQKDSVRRIADQARAQVTPDNFAQMAARYTTEPGGGERGGMLGVYPRQMMVPQFSDAVAALQPGQISPVFETQFGFHIAQRLPYALARDQFAEQYGQSSMQRAESTYLAGLATTARVSVKDDAPAQLKRAAADFDKSLGSDDVLATYQGGELTVGEVVSAVNAAQGPAAAQQIAAAPDSVLRQFVEEVTRRELLVREAERAGLGMPADERARLVSDWSQLVSSMWEQLGVTPQQLADSGSTPSERERIAAARVEAYLDRMMAGQAQLVQVPAVLGTALREKFEGRVTQAGIDRAVERAQVVRIAADSTRSAAQPGTAIPMPPAGQGPAGQAPGNQPQP
ncbi:MAG: peptidyl-prolyl cis-trans isomerase [Gemmatimonadaceae bacterium]|nr:peptidyl-prolyl cis-trans isomerase [Gemmatimonadaceae bacterium]